MTLLIHQQIVAAYENANMSIEDIGENFGLEPRAVEMVLQQDSPEYRKRQREKASDGSEDVSHNDALEMLDIIKSIARCHADEGKAGVAMRAAQYVRDEHYGRNNARAQIGNKGNVTINVLDLSSRLAAMERAKARTNALAEGKSIEISSEKVA